MAKRKKYEATVNIGKLHIEAVTPRMNKPCDTCGNPMLDGVRLVHVKGSGKWQTTRVFCPTCGLVILDDFIHTDLEGLEAKLTELSR